MLFPTVIFCLFFLVFLGVWWSLPAQSPKARTGLILAANLIFYAWLDPRWSLGLLVLASVAWIGSYWIAQSKTGSGARTLKGWVVVLVVLGALFALKYVPWLAQMYNVWGHTWAWQPVALPEWAYPAGLSFFTFHALAIVLGVWHNRIEVPRYFPAVAHISFFPTLMAGPVLRADSVARRLDEPFYWKDVAWGEGIARFAVGMSFKWVFATQAAAWADPVFQGLFDTRASTWWGVHAYGFQIFFDFAGYSLMAIGVSMMMGFKLPENFTHPYTATSIQEFWRRWHRSLSFFFRDHLYIDAFGGSRNGASKAMFAAVATMLVSGLWHGASLMFLAWGAWHAGMLVAERLVPGRGSWPSWFGWLVTFEFSMWGWVWFRSDTWETALDIFRRGWGSGAGTESMAWATYTWIWAGVMVGVVALESRWLPEVLKLANRYDAGDARWHTQIAGTTLMVGWAWALMVLGPDGVPNFIYNGF